MRFSVVSDGGGTIPPPCWSAATSLVDGAARCGYFLGSQAARWGRMPKVISFMLFSP
jgi:hypothetical protein